MKILLDNNAIDKLANNIELIKAHPEVEFFICREAVEEVSNNKSYNPTYNIISLLKVGVKYLPNSIFILGHSKLDGESTFCSASTSMAYKNILNKNCSNVADAIIAATAVSHNYILLTDDLKLYAKMKKFGYQVMKFNELKETIS